MRNKEYTPIEGWQASRLPHLGLLNNFIFITCSTISEIVLLQMALSDL